MLHKLKFRLEIKIITSLIALSLLVAFGHVRQEGTFCNNIVIKLENERANYFVSKEEILQTIHTEEPVIIGKKFSRINLRKLENSLDENPYIFDAQLYGNIKGDLIVEVQLHRPIARLLCRNTPDIYIAEDGTLLPTSRTFNTRVLLISGYIVSQLATLENLHQLKMGKQLMNIIQFIHKDPFWKAQVAQLDFDKQQNMFIYPQVTNQRIEFGNMSNIEIKFKKLMIFYQKILPQKGWLKYKQVNVKYENQIIAK